MRDDSNLHAGSAPDLYVDLDGTLTRADVSLETFVAYARRGLAETVLLIIWLVRGRAFAKTMVARRQPVKPEALPWRAEVLSLIETARASGSRVILASATHRRNVERIARHLGLFDAVLATSARRNLKGKSKLSKIREVSRDAPFDYVGDCGADRAIWQHARQCYSVGHLPRAMRIEMLGADAPSPLRSLVKAMRLHQWAKNALILVPLLTSGLVADPVALGRAILAMLLFSLLASGVYLLNDVLDIEADRAHAQKRSRPLAAGTLTIPAALGAAGLLLTLPIVTAGFLLGPGMAMILLAYLGLTTAYSLRLKSVMTLDVIALACLYTIRIFAGAIAIGVATSFWLLTFSVFLFLSLAYLKRYTELALTGRAGEFLKGRGYSPTDIDTIATAGISAGMVSILVLALFINAARTDVAYRSPDLLWLLCLLLLYWINRVWMMARRGEVEGDPVAFAVRDRRSMIVAAAMSAVVLAAQMISI